MAEKCFCTHQMGLHWFNTGNCTECGCTLFHPNDWPDWPTDEKKDDSVPEAPSQEDQGIAGVSSFVGWNLLGGRMPEPGPYDRLSGLS